MSFISCRKKTLWQRFITAHTNINSKYKQSKFLYTSMVKIAVSYPTFGFRIRMQTIISSINRFVLLFISIFQCSSRWLKTQDYVYMYQEALRMEQYFIRKEFSKMIQERSSLSVFTINSKKSGTIILRFWQARIELVVKEHLIDRVVRKALLNTFKLE